MEISKYVMKITGMEKETLGERGFGLVFNAWKKNTGIEDVAGGQINVDVHFETDEAIYNALFYSTSWTGLWFEGFP